MLHIFKRYDCTTLMQNIRYLLIYVSILIVLQMLYFSIYNIPIYKIYCELNNYYLNSQNLYNQINYKFYIYTELETNIYKNKILVSEVNKYLEENRCNIDINKNSLIYNIEKYYKQVEVEKRILKNSEINLYVVIFKATTTNVNLVEFVTLQSNIYIAPSETYLVFFRIYNPTDYIIKGISIYFISPNTVSVYLLKIQCFCFDELLLYKFESVDLPILFYISSEIIVLNLKIIAYIQIHITYLFILSGF
ncbi:Cytochrome c oxidase assembly protein CtaG [compost metagenome]